MEKKAKHGGRRPGAGRKTVGNAAKKRRTYALSPDVIEKIESLGKRSDKSKVAVIEAAIRWLYDLDDNLD